LFSITRQTVLHELYSLPLFSLFQLPLLQISRQCRSAACASVRQVLPRSFLGK